MKRGIYFIIIALHPHARHHFEGHYAPKQSLIALRSKIAKQFIAMFILKQKFLLSCRAQRKMHEVPAVNNCVSSYYGCVATTRSDNPKNASNFRSMMILLLMFTAFCFFWLSYICYIITNFFYLLTLRCKEERNKSHLLQVRYSVTPLVFVDGIHNVKSFSLMP